MIKDKNINSIADYIEGKILEGIEESPKVSILIVGESEAEGAVLLEGPDLDTNGCFMLTPYSREID